MASKPTTLCIVNTTETDIEDIHVTVRNDRNWVGSARPDQNFQGISIKKYDSHCELEVIKNTAFSAWYDMDLVFFNGTLKFSNNQRNARNKHNRKCSSFPGLFPLFLNIYQSSGGNLNALYVRSNEVPDNASWMGELLRNKSNVKLNEITMPGSHDAGMYQTRFWFGIICRKWIRTQSGNINQQLGWGSRYFDLRVYDAGFDLRVGHFDKVGFLNLGRYGPKLSDILNQVKIFIQSDAGRSETVILKFSHTMYASPCLLKKPVNKVASEIVKQVEEILGENLYISRDPEINLAETPLRELAGKVVAVFDVEFQPYCDATRGIFPYRDYDPDGKPDGYGALRVYDKYSDTNSYPNMRDDQVKKLIECGGYDHEYLFLLSWTLTRLGVGKLMDIRVLSNLANSRLLQILSGIRNKVYKQVPNIVYYDFVDPYLNHAIIDLNFNMGEEKYG